MKSRGLHSAIARTATRLGLVCAGVLFAGTAMATPINLIQNGNFESGSASWTLSGNVDVTGPAGVPYFGGGTAAQDGTQLVAFNSGDTTPNGTLSQTFATTAGTHYNVWFDYGATAGTAPYYQDILAEILGANGVTVLSNKTARGTNPPAALQTFQFSFVADGSTATILFSDVGSNNTYSLDGLLDNVFAEVPEPSELALMLLGLFAMTWLVREHRRRWN